MGDTLRTLLASSKGELLAHFLRTKLKPLAWVV